MKVFVINMERSKERWHKINTRLKELNIEFERIEAVDGSKLDDHTKRFNSKRFKLEAGHDLVPGEAGCSLSHISIWERIIKENLPHAVVLEDDVEIDDMFVNFINEQKMHDFDYLKLEVSSKNFIASENIVYQKYISETNGNQFVFKECDPIPYSTGGYFISNKGARIFLNSSKQMYYPIDILPRYTFPYTKQGFLEPAVIGQDDNVSTIVGRNFMLSKPLVDKIHLALSKLFSKLIMRKLTVIFKKLNSKRIKTSV
ncbi:MAG: glycosyltransferase family 25 protein [Alteromonadaceae bacterium]|nr:glycosyltransferase family 25 protein [Alteromonadaceae bacterium]